MLLVGLRLTEGRTCQSMPSVAGGKRAMPLNAAWLAGLHAGCCPHPVDWQRVPNSRKRSGRQALSAHAQACLLVSACFAAGLACSALPSRSHSGWCHTACAWWPSLFCSAMDARLCDVNARLSMPLCLAADPIFLAE